MRKRKEEPRKDELTPEMILNSKPVPRDEVQASRQGKGFIHKSAQSSKEDAIKLINSKDISGFVLVAVDPSKAIGQSVIGIPRIQTAEDMITIMGLVAGLFASAESIKDSVQDQGPK